MSQPRRDWSDARAKVEREGLCRMLKLGGCEGPLEAAHVIGRAADKDTQPRKGKRHLRWTVMPQRVVPLCRAHHSAYDRREVDLLPFLDIGEQMWAVSDAGGLELARVRTCPSLYARGKAVA